MIRLDDPVAAVRLADSLRAGASRLRALPSRGVIAALGRVHRGWAARDSGLRPRAVERLHATTGYAPATLDLSLRHLFRSLSGMRMREAVARDLALAPDALRMPPALTWIVAAGNVPVASLPALVLALLAGSPCLLKASSEELVLPALYAESLAAIAPELASHVAIASWRGGDADVERAIGERAAAVIAYGSDEALADLRTRVSPTAAWLGFGHRVSFGYATAERADRRNAAAAARDVAIYDQQGCLSPVAFFCEDRGDAPERFAELLARELERLRRRWPRRPLEAGEAAAVNRWRARVQLDVALGKGHCWRAPERIDWTVALLPHATIADAARDRSVLVASVSGVGELAARLAPAEGRLSTASLAAPEQRREGLTRALAGLGVLRVCEPGRMQLPDPLAPHDGRRLLAELGRRVAVR